MELIRYTEASSPGFRASLDIASVSLSRLHKCSKLTLTLELDPMFILSQSEVSVVKSHRCCDGDSARGSSQLSMAPCYRSQLIDGAHVSRQRLSTAGRGHSALTDVDQTTFLPVGRAAKCGCAEC